MSSFSWLLLFVISLVQLPVLCVPQGKVSLLLTSEVRTMKLSNRPVGAIITGTEAASEFLPSAAPELSGPDSASGSGCGGCYLVADVAGEHIASTDWRDTVAE